MNTKANILLENGLFLKGKSLGYRGITGGELCFNTSMTGYQEILTDPSYSGQIINMTYPHIGNYGVNSEDVESNKIQCSGFIVKQASDFPSNYRSEGSLDSYLKENQIVGIQDVDTRMITRIIRDEGAMNAVISTNNLNRDEMQKYLGLIPNMDGLDLAQNVSCDNSYIFNPNSNKKYKIAAFDFGIKTNILRILDSKDCEIKVFPAKANKDEILNYRPDGIFLSNGPGDPAACTYAIQTVKSLLGIRPIFGICLGHQILALALGAKTFKLKFGHRGCNHPVKNLQSEIIEITSQNHGFSVLDEELPKDIQITHTNLNDGTIEGILCEKYDAFSVQYHPESSPGPHDSKYLFNIFLKLIQRTKINA